MSTTPRIDAMCIRIKGHADTFAPRYKVEELERELNQWKADAERLAHWLGYYRKHIPTILCETEQDWLATTEGSRVVEVLQQHNDMLNPVKSPFGHFHATVSDAVPTGKEASSLWCEPCQAFHPKPQNYEHWLALKCLDNTVKFKS